MKILIVEDEIMLAQSIQSLLEKKGFEVQICHDGESGADYALLGIYDLLILDVMMPKMNGLEVARQVRAKRCSTPILMLTARSGLEDRIAGLNAGADYYLTKPFDIRELLARLRVLTRRKGEVILDEIKYHDITLHIDQSKLSCDKSIKNIHLNFKECEMLKMFLSRPEVIISKQELITRIWGYDSDAGDNNVEAYISFLRKKLVFVESEVEIVSLKKLGYKLTSKV